MWKNENASTQMILNMNNIISKRMFGKGVATDLNMQIYHQI